MELAARRAIVALVTAWAILPCAVSAQDVPDEGGAPAAEASPWAFEATPYFWTPEVEGSTRVGDVTAPVDVDFDKVFGLLVKGDLLAGGGHFEAEYDRRFSFFLDAFGGTARPSGDVTFGSEEQFTGKADLTMNWAFFEFGPAYRVLDWPREPDTRPIQVDVLAGGRLMYFYEKIALRGDGPLGFERVNSASTTWVDPFVGGRFTVPAGPIDILFHGDIGGFDVGSKLVWNLIGGIEIDLPWRPGSSQTSLIVVYKALSFDYDGGRGAGEEAYDLTFGGPALGLQFAF